VSKGYTIRPCLPSKGLHVNTFALATRLQLSPRTSVRLLSICALFAVALLRGTTLQQLSLDDMTLKSTAIVRGKVQQTETVLRGSVVYTMYRLQVSEQWKGTQSAQIDFAVLGGTAKGIHQAYSGAPALTNGQEYVLFLWTSRGGLTQIIGLSQGAFNLTSVASGDSLVTRFATTDRVVDQLGNDLASVNFQMRLGDMRSQVAHTLRSAHQ
jgi:hypothetical protein